MQSIRTLLLAFKSLEKPYYTTLFTVTSLRPFCTAHRKCYINIPKDKQEQFVKLMEKRPIQSYMRQVLDILPASLDDVLCTIPAGSNPYILYCLNARDFPLSLTKRFFRIMKLRNLDISRTYFIINMLDDITDDLSIANIRRYESYYRQSLPAWSHNLQINMDFKVDPSHIFVMTNKISAPIVDLYQHLSLESCRCYIIGVGNTGKSTLAKRLMRMILRNVPTASTSSTMKNVDIKEHEGFPPSKVNYYYSISPYPFSTRKNFEYEISALDSTLIDTPGFLHHRKGIYGILDKKCRLNLQQQFRFDHKQRYILLKTSIPSQVFSVNDVFFLKPRGVSSFKYRRFLYGKLALYNTYTDGYEHMISSGKFVKPMIRRYIIPPFEGKIDVIFENIGFIELDNTTNLESADVWQLYAPKNIKKIVRIPSLSVSILTGQEPIYIPLKEVPMLLNFKKFESDLSKYCESSFKILEPYMEHTKIKQQH